MVHEHARQMLANRTFQIGLYGEPPADEGVRLLFDLKLAILLR